MEYIPQYIAWESELFGSLINGLLEELDSPHKTLPHTVFSRCTQCWGSANNCDIVAGLTIADYSDLVLQHEFSNIMLNVFFDWDNRMWKKMNAIYIQIEEWRISYEMHFPPFQCDRFTQTFYVHIGARFYIQDGKYPR